MIKKYMSITAAVFLLLLSSCCMSTDEHAGRTSIVFLQIDQHVEDEKNVDIFEQATSSDIFDNNEEVDDEIMVNVDINTTIETDNESDEGLDTEIGDGDQKDPEMYEADLADSKNEHEEVNYSMNIRILIGDRSFACTLYENETTYAFIEQLPLTITMSELNGNEKYYYLDHSLPTNSSRQEEIHAGDLMLFGNDCLVLFYEDFSTSYSYTAIGYVSEPNQLADVLGRGSIQVVFEKEE